MIKFWIARDMQARSLRIKVYVRRLAVVAGAGHHGSYSRPRVANPVCCTLNGAMHVGDCVSQLKLGCGLKIVV